MSGRGTSRLGNFPSFTPGLIQAGLPRSLAAHREALLFLRRSGLGGIQLGDALLELLFQLGIGFAEDGLENGFGVVLEGAGGAIEGILTNVRVGLGADP